MSSNECVEERGSMGGREGGMFGGGPTALVAVERTNFVLIEKSPALNPIYKPANMAGVGCSLARSLARLTLVLPRLPLESRYTTAPGFEPAMHHVSWIRDFKVGVLGDDGELVGSGRKRKRWSDYRGMKFSHLIERERKGGSLPRRNVNLRWNH